MDLISRPPPRPQAQSLLPPLREGQRHERAIRKGSSAIDETEDFNGLVWVNRAGPREGCLTVAEYKKYVLSERVSCGLPAIGTAIAHGTTAGQTP